jgi:phosphatidylcholine synthase
MGTNRSMSGARLAAWGVHLYTASGALLGLLALDAVVRGAHQVAFGCMALATFIDSTDGTLARRARVKEILPHFDGAKLDDIIDYLNYVVVPLLLVHQADLLPAGKLGLAVAATPLLASAYGFCQADAKTSDHFFTGFPSYWNIVVFYLYALGTPPWLNAAVLLGFAALVFVPVRYLYPSRTSTARRSTYVLGTVWAVLVLALLLQFPDPPRTWTIASLFFPAYYFLISVHLHLRSTPSPPRAARDTG